MSMDCLKCAWREKPARIRQNHCIACSMKFASSSKVRWGTNELSNKGQSFESYDNHASNMVDDRDVALKINPEYVQSRTISPYRDSLDEALEISRKTNLQISELAFEYVRRFVFELTEMTDLQICLFKDIMRGCKKSEFSKRHRVAPSKTDQIYKTMISCSPVIQNFILLSQGTLNGSRGIKHSKSDKFQHSKKPHNRTTDKAPVGAMQMLITFDEFGHSKKPHNRTTDKVPVGAMQMLITFDE